MKQVRIPHSYYPFLLVAQSLKEVVNGLNVSTFLLISGSVASLRKE